MLYISTALISLEGDGMTRQINTRFHNGMFTEMEDFVGEDKLYANHQDLIRDAVRDKLRALKADA